ncbi:MAG: hypothetical protein V4655_07700 [Bdellovibrionota bacterium]|nr:MAG: hypothetical protein EOP10_16690 [Pseudomonadota bacterium]
MILRTLFLLSLTACQTVTSISVSQLPSTKKRTNEISASASSPIILYIPFGTDFIDDARSQLIAQCPSPRRIEGVLSKQVTTNYFLTLIMKDEVQFTAYCSGGKETASEKKKKG